MRLISFFVCFSCFICSSFFFSSAERYRGWDNFLLFIKEQIGFYCYAFLKRERFRVQDNVIRDSFGWHSGDSSSRRSNSNNHRAKNEATFDLSIFVVFWRSPFLLSQWLFSNDLRKKKIIIGFLHPASIFPTNKKWCSVGVLYLLKDLIKYKCARLLSEKCCGTENDLLPTSSSNWWANTESVLPMKGTWNEEISCKHRFNI